MPGLALTFRPRPHQVAAVARMVHEAAVLLAHEVGAGKTAEMIIGVTELRRLGLARKPAVIVPSHMLEQFAREWLQLYPHARVLVARREELQGERRRRFIARCATGDWDGVVMSRSAFERIPLSPGEQQAYMDRELELMHTWLENAKSGDGDGLTVKRLQGALLRAGERLKAKLDSAKDPGITFEATGIDYLCVDEAHGYKNLRTASNIADAAIDGSMRASDLDMKTGYLRRRNGARVVTFATATPIANSVTEAYVMQRYLRPDLLLTDQSRPSASSLEMSGFIGADHALREARPGSQFCLRDARIAAPAARCRDPSELNVGAHGHDAPLWQAEEIYRALRCA